MAGCGVLALGKSPIGLSRPHGSMATACEGSYE